MCRDITFSAEIKSFCLTANEVIEELESVVTGRYIAETINTDPTPARLW